MHNVRSHGCHVYMRALNEKSSNGTMLGASASRLFFESSRSVYIGIPSTSRFDLFFGDTMRFVLGRMFSKYYDGCAAVDAPRRNHTHTDRALLIIVSVTLYDYIALSASVRAYLRYRKHVCFAAGIF